MPEADPYPLTRETFHQLARKVAADVQDDQAEKKLEIPRRLFRQSRARADLQNVHSADSDSCRDNQNVDHVSDGYIEDRHCFIPSFRRNPYSKSAMQYSITKFRQNFKKNEKIKKIAKNGVLCYAFVTVWLL